MSARARNTIMKYLAIALGTALLGAVLAGAAAALRPQTYTSTTTVMVTPAPSLPSTQTESVSQYILTNMPTYNNLATTSSVLDGAVDHGRTADEISNHLSVEVPTGSSLVELAYTDTSEEQSTAIADDLAAGLRDTIRQFSPQSGGSSQVDVSIVQEAGAATKDNKPSLSRWTLVGAGIGGVLGVIGTQAFRKRRGTHRDHAGSSSMSRSGSAAS